ncbi:hypothetical protein ACIQUQ_24200 [Streptomyces sp. NPDC101118]
MTTTETPRWMRIVSTVADVLLKILASGNKSKSGSSNSWSSCGSDTGSSD